MTAGGPPPTRGSKPDGGRSPALQRFGRCRRKIEMSPLCKIEGCHRNRQGARCEGTDGLQLFGAVLTPPLSSEETPPFISEGHTSAMCATLLEASSAEVRDPLQLASWSAGFMGMTQLVSASVLSVTLVLLAHSVRAADQAIIDQVVGVA
jgi:hypothetical protein